MNNKQKTLLSVVILLILIALGMSFAHKSCESAGGHLTTKMVTGINPATGKFGSYQRTFCVK